ncbi:MAG: segregation/condensation protein A [Euryarchaeota archaeon]|nr:segregation/condensation protein A [Euryarchaeota archaeon]
MTTGGGPDAAANGAAQEDFDERSIDILVSLAKNGEIDPWDIDIVDVTDRFLARVAELEKLDLRVSSRTLLFASMLLRMKSDALEESEPKDLYEEEPVEDDLPACFPALKPKVRRHAKRRVTLSELIQELKKATQRKERSEVRRLVQVQVQEFDALAVAHSEDIERQVKDMKRELKRRFALRDQVLFSELIVDDTVEAIVETYIPLLFMATRRQIQLEQKELFGDLSITCKNL